MFACHLHRALTALAAIALLGGSAAAQSVGVTSATHGGPLGKPPAERERVLKVGIDVKANELITTGATDRAHLVFLDGTALTVGPQARLTIDRFVYDADNRVGELAINATQGVFRLVGGKISKTRPIVVNTPSSTLTIRGGIMLFSVSQGVTSSTFVFGHEMTATAAGKTQTVKGKGWQITTLAGQAPGAPRLLSAAELQALMTQLEAAPGQGTGSNADAALQGSGLAELNSGQGPATWPNNIQGGPAPNLSGTINDALVQKNYGATVEQHKRK
ncbi:MAG TPA: FecR domain-containing protein [Reyranellaceae bacterium]|nr:FecR domain-containing protein [Reyranellaceae bacterium]